MAATASKPTQPAADVRSRAVNLHACLTSEATRWYSDFGIGAIRDDVLIRNIDGFRITASITEPIGNGPHPIIIYFHGGGWCADRARTYRALSFRLAESGYLVFNVDYRLAPEAPFPAGFDDCQFALEWVYKTAHAYNGDPAKIVVGGDSAGANLAAAVSAISANSTGGPNISATFLLYGAYSLYEGPIKSLAEIYLGNNSEKFVADARVNPILAAHNLPPSFVAVGSDDYLYDQSEQLVNTLLRNNIDHDYLVLPNTPHGYMKFEILHPREYSLTLDRMTEFLRKHLEL